MSQDLGPGEYMCSCGIYFDELQRLGYVEVTKDNRQTCFNCGRRHLRHLAWRQVMKIQPISCIKSISRTLQEVGVGTVFSFGTREAIYLRVCGGVVELSSNEFYNTNRLCGPFENYKEYPNARVVLE